MNRRHIAFIMVIAIVMACLTACGDKGGNGTQTSSAPSSQTAQAKTEAPSNATPKVTAEPTPVPTEDPNKSKVISVGAYTKDDFHEGKYKSEYVCDGETDVATERWSCASGATAYDHWLILDLKSGYIMTDFEIYFEYVSLFYKISVSMTGLDDSWTVIYDSFLQDAEFGGGLVDGFSVEAQGRFVKLETYVPEAGMAEAEAFWEANYGRYYFGIYEMFISGRPMADYKETGEELDIKPVATVPPTKAPETPKPTATPKSDNGPDTQKLLSEGKTATSSKMENEASYPASAAFDGDYETRWSAYPSSGFGVKQLTVDLGEVYTLYRNKVTFECCTLYYQILVSDTGEEGTFVSVYSSYLDNMGVGKGVEHEFTLSGAKGRFVRFETYNPDPDDEDMNDILDSYSGNSWYSIYEWEIYGV